MAAVAAAPLDYYGLRSAALLGGPSPPTSGLPLNPRPPDWNAIERWLLPRSDFSSPTAAPSVAPTDLPGVDRALELLHAGLAAESDAEFDALLDEAARRGPDTLYRLARTLAEQGRTSLSARAGARLLGASADPPDFVLQPAYPIPYYDIVRKEATANGFQPPLLLALVRQESFYDPNAASPASATGLTQVVPGTASDIATALGDADFATADLLRPKVSLRYGAYYLGQQLKRFDGNVSAALAAYNGGAGNAERWLESAGNDPDVFLETIDFPETRAYVELVLEHYAAYLYGYGVTNEPSLALP